MIWRLYYGWSVLKQRVFGINNPAARWFSGVRLEALDFLLSRGVDPHEVSFREANIIWYRTRDGNRKIWPDLYTAVRGWQYLTVGRAGRHWVDRWVASLDKQADDEMENDE